MGLGVAVVLTGVGVVRFGVGAGVTVGCSVGVKGLVTFEPLESQPDNRINKNIFIKMSAARHLENIMPFPSFVLSNKSYIPK
mgnify:CR=1 FL=1